MKRYQLTFGIALVSLSLLGGPALAADHGQDGGTSKALSASSAIWGSRVPGDLLSGLEASCTISEDLSERASLTTLAELADNLGFLLGSDVYEAQLIQLARYLLARDVADIGLEQERAYSQLLEQIAVSNPEDMLPALEELKDRILLTARLREARATLASLKFTGDGKIQLTLKLDTEGVDGSMAVDQAVLSEFERARRQGVDCSSSDVFRISQGRLATLEPNPERTIRHRDLQELLTRTETFQRATLRYANASGPLAEAPNVQDIVAAFQEIREWHVKAQNVLGETLTLYKDHLEQFFTFDNARELPPARANENVSQAVPVAVQESPANDNSVPATAMAEGGPELSTEASQAPVAQPSIRRTPMMVPPGPQLAESYSSPVPAAVPAELSVGSTGGLEAEAVAEAQTVLAAEPDEPMAEVPTALSMEQPEPVAEVPSPADSATENMIQPESSLPVALEREPSDMSDTLSADAPEPTPDMLAQQKAEVIEEVMTQIDLLRRQAGKDGAGDMIRPLALANNLLYRSNRVFQLADMLVVSEKDDQTYSCSISDDTVHISFRTNKHKLASMNITVDEKYLGQTLMSWTISVSRDNDKNFRLDAEFDGMKSSLVVEDAEVVRFPNHHQLLVLMNRLSDITDTTISMKDPVRTASR